MSLFQDIPDLTPEQFQKFAQLIHKEAFINLKETKITLLSNRLRKRLRALSLKTFDEYYDYLIRNRSTELKFFLEVVTTNESYFFRTTQNFDLLKESLLPDLLKSFPGETLMFWSAGCSTGEEPYNLAIELNEAIKVSGIFPFHIIASDISQRVVDFARQGKYNGRKIEKIPHPILSRYFRKEDEEGNYVVREDIKQKIEFRLENLFTSSISNMHCIFCRNVMIYFSREDQEALANRFFRALKPGGYLIIGHSESLHMMNTPFESVHYQNGVAYHKPKSTIA